MAIIEEVLDDEEVQEKLDRIKQEGNQQFGLGNYSDAVQKYSEALEVCPPDFNEFRTVLHSNISACYIKLEKWDEAVDAATTALEADPKNPKALERRGYANQRLDKVDDSIVDYKAIIEEYPKRVDLQKKIAECQARSLEKQEEMKKGVIEKLKTLGNVCLKPFGLSTDSFEMTPNGTGGYSIGMKGQNRSNNSDEN
ncbi:unnamed protein product [Auanema sp. JU1783]|nr:unnamed protein product [Auanema sp. JU1783]